MVVLPVVTTIPLDPNRVLTQAVDKLTKVVVIGYTLDGEEYFASSTSDGGDVLWMMARAQHKLMRITDADET